MSTPAKTATGKITRDDIEARSGRCRATSTDKVEDSKARAMQVAAAAVAWPCSLLCLPARQAAWPQEDHHGRDPAAVGVPTPLTPGLAPGRPRRQPGVDRPVGRGSGRGWRLARQLASAARRERAVAPARLRPGQARRVITARSRSAAHPPPGARRAAGVLRAARGPTATRTPTPGAAPR